MERKTFMYSGIAAMAVVAATSFAQVAGGAGAQGGASLGTNTNGTGTASGGLGLGVDAGINPSAGVNRLQGVVDDTHGTVRSAVGNTTGAVRNTVHGTTNNVGRVGAGAHVGTSASVTY